MTDEESFLAAIFANPDDDAPRLMYADWLTERGNPRGEFIRVQIEMSRPQDRRSEVYRGLRGREAELRIRHRNEWLGCPTRRMKGCTFRRGFVETVRISNILLPNAELERLFRLHPVRTLHLRGEVTYEVIKRLMALPLGTLRDLILSRTSYLTSDGVIVLAQSPVLSHLTHLDLSFNRIANRGARALIESPHLSQLTSLDLRGNDISAHAQQQLRERFGDRVRL